MTGATQEDERVVPVNPSMRAVAITAFGGLDHLEIVEIPTPAPAAGEVLVSVRSVAANRTDLFTMQGHAAVRTTLPHIPGLDPAGVIAVVGEGVAGLAVGDRVVVKPSTSCGQCDYCVSGADDACPDQQLIGVHRPGAMAEYVAVPAKSTFKIGDHIGFAEATAVSHSFPVALTMVRDRAGVGPADTVLVTGAAGAIGAASVLFAKEAGARVIAAAGGHERVTYARDLGADVLIDYSATPDFAAEIREAAPDGVSVYIESAGAPEIWDESLKTMARRGRVIVCGAHAGGLVQLNLAWLFRSRVSITGHSGSTLAAFREVFEMAGAGRIKPNIHTRLPLDRAHEAFQILLARRNRGKVILEVTGH
jgi:NADPH:quinone reductase-like Zn-dependent oxidoreductase